MSHGIEYLPERLVVIHSSKNVVLAGDNRLEIALEFMMVLPAIREHQLWRSLFHKQHNRSLRGFVTFHWNSGKVDGITEFYEG